jgi:hypothetical protein
MKRGRLASAAKGTSREVKSDFRQGLKPDSDDAANGTAEACPDTKLVAGRGVLRLVASLLAQDDKNRRSEILLRMTRFWLS